MNRFFFSRSRRRRQRLIHTTFRSDTTNRLRATLERLEERRLLTASPSDYDSVTAEWFTTINEPLLPAAADTGGSATEWFGTESTAESEPGAGGNANWIVRLSPQVLETVNRVADAVGLFTAPGLRVLGGLGLPGQLLLEASSAPEAVLSLLASQGIVSAYEPDLPISVSSFAATSTPNDPRYGDLYGLHNTGQSGGTPDADIDAPEAWQVSTGSRDVIVGVVDTGIDYTHPDLAANIWVNPGEIAGNGIDDDGNGFVDDVHGYDFVNDDGDPFDDNGHGTHCAGTIGGVGNNGTGVAGVNWEVSLMGLKFLSASGSGSTSDAIQAINYATMMRTQFGQNIRVTSNSWGGGGSSSAMRQAIEAGAAADILFVAAAGNDGSDNDATPQYPASYTSGAVVSVAATDRNDALAGFSNYGATSVDLAAPGASIVSTVPGGGYASYSGTSMATPHVAGAAALAIAVDPTLSVADLKTALLGTVDGVSGLTGKVLTGGRLNAGTLIASLSSEPTVPAAPGSILASDGTSLGGVQIAWSGSLFADSYTLYRGESADSATATVLADGLTTTSYLDSAAAIDTVYHYWVTASNEFGISPLSDSDSGFHAPSRSPNDAFADRLALEGLNPTATGTNVDATAEAGEPVHHGVGGGKSVWWTWTAPASGTVVIETVGSDFDTVLAVYDGSDVASLNRLVSNDDIEYGVVLQSRVTFPTAAGRTYQIAVDGWGGEVGSISLGISLDAPEPPAPIDRIALSNNNVLENMPGGTEVGRFTIESMSTTTTNRFRLITETLSWQAARDRAVELGGHLATFTSEAEWQQMLNETGISDLQMNGSWIGATDAASEGVWEWVTGEPFSYTRWATNEPNGSTGENVAGLWPGGTWNDLPADILKDFFILEVPPATATYQLVAGEGDTDNGQFSIEGDAIVTVASFDFESRAVFSVRVRATLAEQTAEQVFTIAVTDANDAPRAVLLSANAVAEDVVAGTVVGGFSAEDEDTTDSHTFALVAGEGDGGNALFALVDGSLVTAGQLDYETAPSHSVRVRATDAAGAFVEQVFAIDVIDVAEGLLVDQIVTGRDGVTVSFDGSLDLSNLDLHNRAAAPENLDVTLVDAAGELVEAALAVNATGDGFRLVVNNGLLAAGDYTLTIRSGETGVVAADGRLLDGNGDGSVGDDYVATFTVDPLPAGTAVVGVPGFFEDAGQEVNLPAAASGGIPVIITAPEGVMSLDMELFYNPALLEVTGIELAAGLPDGALTLINVVTPGHAVVGFFSPQPLGAGSYEVARLLATVPASAAVDQTHVLDVSGVSLNEGLIPAIDDDGIHVVAVGNRAPTGISLAGGRVTENSPVGMLAGTLAAVDPDYGDAFSFALVAGEGDADNAAFRIEGTSLLTKASFDYEAGADRSVRVRVTDAEGESFETVLQIEVVNEIESLHVTGLTPTVDGFQVSFSGPIDPSSLNLYDAMDVLGAADLTLVGELVGSVRGSLVVATDGAGIQFVSSSPLAADSYTVTLRSGDAAFKAVAGGLLDGNADETVGDNYVASFTNILPSVLLGVPSFARGAGQAVNLPADSAAGIPVRLTSDGTVSVLTATLRYDPALLTVGAISPGADLPEGTVLTTAVIEPGLMSLQLEATAALPSGPLTIGSLQANVAAEATLGAAGLISFVNVDADGGVAAGRTAVQLVASLGDTSGDGSYSNADSTLAARLAMRLDTGLVAYATIDPVLVADASGNGSISMLDAAMIAGVAGGQQGPAAPMATPPTQMLLRHSGVYRAADVPDLSGVLSADDSQLLASSRDSAASRARAFADLAAGWAAASASSASIDSALVFAATDSDSADNDELFLDPGLNLG